MVSSFGCAGKQIAIEQWLDLHMPDQQLERFAGGEVFDAKGDDAVDQTPFEAPGAAMENKLHWHQDNSQEKVCDRKERADEPVIKSRLFFTKYLVDVIGDVGKVLHNDRPALRPDPFALWVPQRGLCHRRCHLLAEEFD